MTLVGRNSDVKQSNRANHPARREGMLLTRLWLVAMIESALLLGQASAQGSWTQMKPIPQGANEVVGAAVDGLLYVYGGERMRTQHVYGGVNLKTQPLGMFWSYDPKADTWTQLKSNPVPVHHGAAVGIGKKFYVLGGFRLPDEGRIGWVPENKAWVYDTETQSWSALPPMPTPRGALAAVAVDNKIYVVGGAKIPSGMELPGGLTAGGPVELVGTMEVFDTEKNSWTTLKSMPLPRNHHDVAHLDGKLYVIGGMVGSCFPGGWSSNVSMNEVYDITTDTWSTRAPMVAARSAIGVAALDGRIYVIGGEGWVDESGRVFRANEAYDPKSNSWAEEVPMPTPRHGFAKGVIDGKLYAVSGVNIAGMFSVVAVNEVYTP
jgi:N-acetylneuraminic acid mutarotase